MTTDLGPLFPANYLDIPPHMSDGDYAIWRRWHAIHYAGFHGWYFDAAVGQGAIIPDGTPNNLAAMWTRLTKKRIDAIGIRDGDIWIIEVRDSAGSSAMGAVLAYIHLLKDDNPFSLPLIPVIITDHADRDTRRVIEAYGVDLIEI